MQPADRLPARSQAPTTPRRRVQRLHDGGSRVAPNHHRPRTDGRTLHPLRQGQGKETGDHRLRDGLEPAPDRRPPGPAPARRRGPQPLHLGSLGPCRGPPRRGLSWRYWTGRAPSGSRRWPSTRSFLGATHLGWNRASEHDGGLLPQCTRPHGLVLGSTTGAVSPLRVRHLRCRQGHCGGGDAASGGPARGPDGSRLGAGPGCVPHRHGGQPNPGQALAACRGGVGESGAGRRPGRLGQI